MATVSALARCWTASRRRLDLALGAGVDNDDLQPEAASRRLHASISACDITGLFGFTSTAILVAVGATSCSNSKPLWSELAADQGDPGGVAARPIEAGDKTQHRRDRTR